MKNILKKINKKFLGLFIILFLLNILFFVLVIFSGINFLEQLLNGFFIRVWLGPAVILLLPFVELIDNNIWFLGLFMINLIIFPAIFWTLITYFIFRLVKTIKKLWVKTTIKS